ncbi:radical SAM protein [bacterium]|nr:radical SAM protein [bacterium]
MLLTRTRVYCPDCGESHDGEVVVRGGAVYGITHCGDTIREHRISSNAELYLRLRGRSMVDPAAPAGTNLKHFINFIEITNSCNFNCAICVAHEPGEQDGHFLALDEVVRRAEIARRGGARILHLIGGEPTLHPDLAPIVARLARMKLSVAVISNGYLLGRDPGFARRLKAAGLSRVCLQFDSLDHATLHKLHRDHLREKEAAIRNILDAGLNIGFNCIVTRDNLAELPRLLDHHLQLGPRLRNMMFTSAAPAGRFEVARDEGVDREEIIMSLLGGGEKYRFDIDDIFPLPTYHPWGLEVHPDCGVNLVLMRTPEGILPLNRLIDLGAAYRRLSGVRDGEGFYARLIRPALVALAAARPGQRLKTLHMAVRMLLGRPDVSLINVGIADYRAVMFLDEQRLSRCSSVSHTSIGPVKNCYYYFGGPRHPGSRINEIKRRSP